MRPMVSGVPLPSEQSAIGFTGLMPGDTKQVNGNLNVASQQGNLLSAKAVLGRLHTLKHCATWCHTRDDPKFFQARVVWLPRDSCLGEVTLMDTPFPSYYLGPRKEQRVVGKTRSARGIVR